MKPIDASTWIVSCSLAGAVAGDFEIASPTLAQILPDNTLPINSSVVPSCTLCIIEGGTLEGNNLFHSFTEFSVPTGGEAIFNNLDTVEHIFSRVTGSSTSNINGFIRANGTANLFLINPNGILFGPNAQLDIGGSFIASTANAIQFKDQAFFSVAEPQSSSLLSIEPTALFFNGTSNSVIESRSIAPAGLDLFGNTISGLRVQDGESLAFIGGDVSIVDGRLYALEGQIALAGVIGQGTVNLSDSNNRLSFSFPDDLSAADISLRERTILSTYGLRGGEVLMWGQSIELQDGSVVQALTFGPTIGGDVTITASESLALTGSTSDGIFGSALFSQNYGAGRAGNLIVTAPKVSLRDGGQISTQTFSEGAGGELIINASESLEVLGQAPSPDGFSSGLISRATVSTGPAGSIRLNTGQLLVQSGGFISSGTFDEGLGGPLVIEASNSVTLSGTTRDGRFPSGLFSSTEGSGASGRLSILTPRLLIENGAQVASGSLGSGDANNLNVTASESILLIGTSDDGQFSSGLFSETQAEGDASNVNVTTPNLSLQDGAQISASTNGGKGGDVLIVANVLAVADGAQIRTTTSGPENAGDITLEVVDAIDLTGPASGLFANTEEGSRGNGGTIFIDPQTVTIGDRAEITVDSRGTGIGGNIELQANSLKLADGASISADTINNTGGNILLRLQDTLLLRRGSVISTNAGIEQGAGDGGNIEIFIEPGFVVAVPVENSDITANAFAGRGGNIDILTQGLLGIEPRTRLTSSSDITASSESGISGTIEINNPSFESDQGLVVLPFGLLESSQLIAQGCDPTAVVAQGEFYTSGRGGVVPLGSDVLSSSEVLDDLRLPWTEETPIAEAETWFVNNIGEVVLTAALTEVAHSACWQ